MDGAPLIGGHRFQGDGDAGSGHPLGHTFGHIGQGLVAPRLISRNVDEQPNPLAESLAGEEADQELKGPESLPPAADKKPRVVSIDVEDRPPHVLSIRMLEADYRRDPHLPDEVLQNLRGRSDQVGWSLKECDADLCKLDSDAQNTGLPSANDVYFDVHALGVEFL